MLNKFDWNGCARLLRGKARPSETSHAQRRRLGSRTARGKRVPYFPINVRFFTNPQKNCRQI
ncbi:hypothetical protein ABIE66_003109 [Peribacillus sp. B2I2]